MTPRIPPELADRLKAAASRAGEAEQCDPQSVLENGLEDLIDELELDASLEVGAAQCERGECVDAREVLGRLALA